MHEQSGCPRKSACAADSATVFLSCDRLELARGGALYAALVIRTIKGRARVLRLRTMKWSDYSIHDGRSVGECDR